MKIEIELDDAQAQNLIESLLGSSNNLEDNTRRVLGHLFNILAAQVEAHKENELPIDIGGEAELEAQIEALAKAKANPAAVNLRGVPLERSYDMQNWEPFDLQEPEELFRKLHNWYLLKGSESAVFVKRLIGDRVETWQWLFLPPVSLRLPIGEEGEEIIYERAILEGRATGFGVAEEPE